MINFFFSQVSAGNETDIQVKLEIMYGTSTLEGSNKGMLDIETHVVI